MRLDMEMTKKQMEERIAQLEKTVMDLQSQLLALALRTPNTIMIGTPQPITLPSIPPIPMWPNPYVGDLPPWGTTICGTGTQSSTKETLRCQAR